MATNVSFNGYAPPGPVEKGLEYRFGMFFDGTRNNKTNTEGREEYNKKNKSTDPNDIAKAAAYKKHGKGDEKSSYQNTYSNVARMLEGYRRGKIYIEGIGTTDKGGDDTLGYALGTGETGVRSKVEKGCRLLAGLLPKGKEISVLILDVFGFSRGAAAARNFVAEVTRSEIKISNNNKANPAVITIPEHGFLGGLFRDAGIIVKRLEVRFLGIYDTVSSYEPRATSMVSTAALNHDFTNDITDLSLNNIDKAKCVFHLTAENEHRENFALTNTRVGLEKSLPGVHCDIGGSYPNGVENVDEILDGSEQDLIKEKNRLVAEGWFTDQQLTVHDFWGKLSGTRDLKNTYSYIPLHLMIEYALEFEEKFPINKELLENQKYVISADPLLVRVKKKLQDSIHKNVRPYVFKPYKDIHAKYKGAKVPEQRFADYQRELTEQSDLRKLRNEYLHWSAEYDGVGMDPAPNRTRVTY
ncbi:phospholipase effector Tle1 domain-containing protein [Pedobacter nototheniae]|uniref:phospholipase effector Tle1 domain-containing protein n=1 Tax=Pedobacter nototheniae TaxID=2488994 RepID=UPI00292DE746|nr:DUF2235 domain-containing protein [Pedobacter nototheniae]